MGSFLGASPASTRPLPRTPKVGINLTPFLHPQPEGLTSLLCFKLVEELGWAAWPQGLLNGVYVLMCGMVPRPPHSDSVSPILIWPLSIRSSVALPGGHCPGHPVLGPSIHGHRAGVVAVPGRTHM